MSLANLLLVAPPLLAWAHPILAPPDPRDHATPQAVFDATRPGPALLGADAPTAPVWFAPALSPLVAAYYPDWTAARLPPESLDFASLDWLDFAFAVPDPTTFTPTLDAGAGAVLRRLVAAAHPQNTSVKLSIGGWTGSAHFSDAVSDAHRSTFAAEIVTLYHQYNLDGIDMDWEYPGEAGAPGNSFSPSDTANFLAFLQLLRALLPADARITAATQVWPFVDASGDHMSDTSAFAAVLDWILLMNYDVWGSSQNPGPNAPLDNACGNSTQPEANAHAAVASWTAAGFPAAKILLGLPAYGYVSRSPAESLRARRRAPANPVPPGAAPAARALDPGPHPDRHAGGSGGRGGARSLRVSATAAAPAADEGGAVQVTSEAGSADSGQVTFAALLAQGALARNAPGATPRFVGAGGFERRWDACSSTPYLRSDATQQIVTYDDPESLGMKAAFVRDAGLLGVNMWDAHGDTREWDLVGGIRRGMGLGLGLPAVG